MFDISGDSKEKESQRKEKIPLSLTIQITESRSETFYPFLSPQ
jgi:hypothetical protein